MTTWVTQLQFEPDILHDGRPTPCLVGRLYLFGPDGASTVTARGDLKVQLRVSDVIGPDGEPKLIEEWPFPDHLLQEMCSNDKWIGWGYRIVLPWATYHPALKNLTMSVAFTPKGGFPIYSRSKLVLQQVSGAAVNSEHSTLYMPAQPGRASIRQP
jgi:hypothetical protein